MLIGAHVSSAGGISNALINAKNLEIEYLQTFLSAPQSYKIREYSDEEINNFILKRKELGIKKCFAHAIYLLNFASDKPQNIYLSKQNLIQTLNLSARLGFDGVIIHIGSTKEDINTGIRKVSEGLKEVLSETDERSILYLENSAGAGNHIGSDYDHLVEIIKQNDGNPRIKVCIDTQHSFAAGNDIKDHSDKIIGNLFAKLGDRISLIHLNDSKTDFNSKKDRHENIGEGKIGYESLKKFCLNPKLENIPFILEVPGFKNTGPDKENLDIVRSFMN